MEATTLFICSGVWLAAATKPTTRNAYDDLEFWNKNCYYILGEDGKVWDAKGWEENTQKHCNWTYPSTAMDGGDQRTNNENAKLRIYATIRRTPLLTHDKVTTTEPTVQPRIQITTHIRIQFSFIKIKQLPKVFYYFVHSSLLLLISVCSF